MPQNKALRNRETASLAPAWHLYPSQRRIVVLPMPGSHRPTSSGLVPDVTAQHIPPVPAAARNGQSPYHVYRHSVDINTFGCPATAARNHHNFMAPPELARNVAFAGAT
jgi:hypothetical protein